MMLETEIISIVCTTIHSILLAIGFYLQIRTFLVVTKEKDLTWKLYVLHGVIILVYYPSCVFVQVAADFIYPLSHFTGGVWFCYAASFVKIFGTVHIFTHSLVIAISRYIFIVYRQKVDRFGKERAQAIFFWCSLFMEVLVTLSYCPEASRVLNAHVEYSACFGTDKEEKKDLMVYLFFCGFESGPADLGYFIFITTECVCVLQSIVTWFSVCNFPEAFLYYKLFQFIHRYTALLPDIICCILLP